MGFKSDLGEGVEEGVEGGCGGVEHPKYGCHSLVITTEVASRQLMKIVSKPHPHTKAVPWL